MSFGSGSFDGWLLKLNSTGAIQWQKTFGGIDGDVFVSAEQTADGGFIAGGDYRPRCITDNMISGLLRLMQMERSNGKEAYGISGQRITLQSFDQTSDGGFIVAAFSSDNLLFKLDSSGNIQWQKHYNISDFAFTHSIHQTSDLGYALVGEVGQSGSSDIWMMKLDSSGNIQWQKMFGGPGSDDWPSAIRSTVDGGYIVAGAIRIIWCGIIRLVDAENRCQRKCRFGLQFRQSYFFYIVGCYSSPSRHND